jgi:Arc/MetJ-type ribon-helix-helix transcriptional regulator
MSSVSSKGHQSLQSSTRLYRDYSAVIRIAVSFVDDSDVPNTKWSERLESLDDFLLVWDWDTSQDRVQAKEYQDFRSGQGLSDHKSQAQKDLDRATRLWWVGRVLESLGRDKEAGKNVQMS